MKKRNVFQEKKEHFWISTYVQEVLKSLYYVSAWVPNIFEQKEWRNVSEWLFSFSSVKSKIALSLQALLYVLLTCIELIICKWGKSWLFCDQTRFSYHNKHVRFLCTEILYCFYKYVHYYYYYYYHVAD